MRKTVLFLTIVIAVHLSAGEWGSRGVSRRFVVRGERLYAADGRGVSVYDISATTPRRIDVEAGDDETVDLAFLGNTLIVATVRGLDRFDVAPDGTLTRAGSLSDVRGTTRIAANDQFLAVASGTGVALLDPTLIRVQQFRFGNTVRAVAFIDGILYVAVSETAIYAEDPISGVELAVLPVDAADFAVSGNILWAAGTGLTSIDASDARDPRIVGRTGSGVLKLALVAASGNRVYAAEPPDAIDIFDVSNPSEARQLATVRDWVNVIAAKDTRVFIAGSIIDAEGPYETGIPLRVYDATSDGIRRAADLTDLAGPVSGAWTDGSIALIVDAPYLRVLDVSKSAEPREIASIAIAEIQDHICVRNGMAILYGRHLVQFVDISNFYEPKLRSAWETQGHAPSAAAFLRDTIVEANEHSGMHVVDYSDPAHPYLVASRKWHYHDLVAGDDAVYLMQLSDFLVEEVTDRMQIIDHGSRAGQGYAQIESIPPSSPGPRYLVWRGIDHVMLLSLEDRFNPREIAHIAIEDPEALGTSDTSVYVASDGVLWKLDAAAPARLVETGMRVRAPQQVSVAGDKLVVADRYSVRVYGPDTAPPPSPPLKVTKRRASRH